MWKEIESAIISSLQSIKKELLKGDIKTHIEIKMVDDELHMLEMQDGKEVNRKTIVVPEQDRDTTVSQWNFVQQLKKKHTFTKVLKAINSSRNLIHSDSVWQKNIINLMGKSYTLDELTKAVKEDVQLLNVQDIENSRDIYQNQYIQSSVKEEKNIALQSVYQALLSKFFMEHDDVKKYIVLQDLLKEGSVIHEVKMDDGSVEYQRDGEVMKGDLIRSYPSLKKIVHSDGKKSRMSKESQVIAYGLVGSWAVYKEESAKRNIGLYPQKIAVIKSWSAIVIANNDSKLRFGKGQYEAISGKDMAIQGNMLYRMAMNYESQMHDIPVAFNGKLYKSRIHAIMSSFVDNVEIGGINEEIGFDELWKHYGEKMGTHKKQLVSQESKVLQQYFDVNKQQHSLLKNLLDNRVFVMWGIMGNDRITMLSPNAYLLVAKQSSLLNSKSKENQQALMKWILRNKDWKETLGNPDREVNIKSFVRDITGQYDMQFIDDNVTELKELQNSYNDWLRYSPIPEGVLPDDLGKSFIESLVKTKYDGAIVANEELYNYLLVHGADIGKHIVRSVDTLNEIKDSPFMIIGLVTGVFLSILHNEMNVFDTMKVEIMDIIVKEKKEFVIGRKERDALRNYMETLGLQSFELKDEVSEGGGASERKEQVEISDQEEERKGSMEKLVQVFVINEKDVRFRA